MYILFIDGVDKRIVYQAHRLTSNGIWLLNNLEDPPVETPFMASLLAMRFATPITRVDFIHYIQNLK
jgi:hypothetical protein